MLKLCSVLLLLFLTACSSDDDEIKPEVPLDQAYGDAARFMAANRYDKAIEQYDEVERLYPGSEWAIRAKIMSAYANYLKGDYDSAVPSLENFVKMHPANSSTPYAYYLIALSYYERISDVGRDQEMTELAMSSLNDVIKRYPESVYARDAKVKIDLVNDHLGGKEMEIGRYYQKRGEFLAAINRFQKVVDEYQTTSHVPEALHRLTECYYAVGVNEQARKYAAVLGYNYPASKWYARSYKLLTSKGENPDEEGWFNRILGKKKS